MAGEIEELIRRDGPITVAAFMRLAVARYYAGRDPLGARGDFVTAPEITQVFGELIGAWIAAMWQSMSSPQTVALVELGPGRGTMMRDVLRTTSRVPGFHPVVHLVETSPALRAQQQGLPASWHETLATVPRMPLLLIANEFFDALPVHQYVGADERRVAVKEGSLAFLPQTGQGIVERSPEREALAVEIAGRIAAEGGAALIADYGYVEGTGETLQAMRRHRPHDVLSDPGASDLTAHVDFGALAAAVLRGGAKLWGPIPQGAFLTRLGIEQRAAKLMESATPDQAVLIRSGCRRLIDPREMGTLFKVIAITRNTEPTPPGFAEAT
jgi:NADH dehydrogenase [ubiquinone] 1 alpha subcomplex assembly factor 7